MEIKLLLLWVGLIVGFFANFLFQHHWISSHQITFGFSGRQTRLPEFIEPVTLKAARHFTSTLIGTGFALLLGHHFLK